MRAENTIQNKAYEYVDLQESKAWVLASCIPGIGLITGCYREALLSYNIYLNENVAEGLPQRKVQDYIVIKNWHHIAGIVQNLLSIAILATLIGLGIIKASPLNIGLVSGGGAFFLALAIRNIYQISKSRDAMKKAHQHLATSWMIGH